MAVAAVLVWRLVTGRYAWRAIPAGLIAALLGAGLGGALEEQARGDYTALFRSSAPAAGRTGPSPWTRCAPRCGSTGTPARTT